MYKFKKDICKGINTKRIYVAKIQIIRCLSGERTSPLFPPKSIYVDDFDF